MKKTIQKYVVGALVVMLPMALSAQTASENYTLNKTYKKATITPVITQDKDSVTTSITYFDGLGRPIQSIGIKQSPNKKDIVSHIQYDKYGRQIKEYLPYASTANDGFYKSGALTAIENFYNTAKYQNTLNPYSEKVLENSPLGRIFEQTAPGNDWLKGTNQVAGKEYSDGHSIRFEYDVNHATEVRKYTVGLSYANNTYIPSLQGGTSDYPAGELSKTTTKDENWVVADGVNHTTEEFKDKSGQVILKRTYNDNQSHDTYYIYDDYGNLTYVLPPKAEGDTATLSTIISTLDNLSYQYKYDNRNRLVEKKIPGKGWEPIIYDKLDRPVMTQDAIQATNNEWLFTKYDVLGRVVYTGIYDHGSSITRTAMQSSFSSQNDTVFEQYETKVTSGTGVDGSYYTNNNFPTSNLEVLTVNYYDNYSFDLAGGIAPTSTYGMTTTNVKNLATGSRVKVLGTSNWTTTVSYYDEKARPIYVYSNNTYLGTIDKVESKLDNFTGKVLETKNTHQKTGNADIVTIDRFEYDHMDRLISQTQKTNSQRSERLVKNHYDELGQLESKLVGSGTQKGYTNITSGVTVSDDVITCTGNGWDIGLSTLGVFQGDGYVEFSPMQNGKYFMAGLSDNNTTGSYQDIDYAIYIHNTAIYVYESGTSRSNQGSYQANDVFRVERIGNKVYYKQNGKVFYTSTVTSTNPLFGDISMYHNGAKIKDFHVVDNSKGLQKVDYTYNVRGWLKNINNDTDNDNDLFNFNLKYNDITDVSKKLFNGNISQSSWNTLNTDTSTRTYTYSYDALNRIVSGMDNTGNYNLEEVQYDKNGNITYLNREGAVNTAATVFDVMDELDYFYESNSNKLIKVADGGNTQFGFKDGVNVGDDYTYDVNGNMISDGNKGITNIYYNHLSLPTSVFFGNSGSVKEINYVYDATGNKLRKEVIDETIDLEKITDYAGNHIYEDGTLQFFNHAEGYTKAVIASPGGAISSFENVYQYKDHLGNVRLSYADTDDNGTIDAATEIIEESNYYPFGLKHKGYNNVTSSNGNSVAQKIGLTGKEHQDELGLGWIDFGWRNYDAALGRWMNLDPLAEEYFNYSPYVYVQNSPLQIIDPNGMEIVIIGDKEYTTKILEYLTNLGNSSQKGAQMILDAIKSKKQFVIFDPKNSDVANIIGDTDSDKYETVGINVDDPDKESDGGNGGKDKSKIPETVETTLAHELSHFNNPDNRKAPIGSSRSNQDEVQALKDENQVRREMGLPERYYHGGNNLYGKKIKNNRLVDDKNYSVNTPGVGKKSFNLIWNLNVNMKKEKTKNYWHNFRSLKKLYKGVVPKKQLTINKKK